MKYPLPYAFAREHHWLLEEDAGALTLVGSRVLGGADRGKANLAKAQVQTVASKIDNYRLDTNRLPGKLDELVTAPSGVNGWMGPYAKASDLDDPWGRPLDYRAPGESQDYDLISLGKDGKPGAGQKAPDPVTVEAVPVARRAIAASYSGTAPLEARGESQVVAKTSGVALAVLVDEGQPVRAGQPLVRLDPADAKVALEQAEACSALVEEVRRELIGRFGDEQDALTAIGQRKTRAMQ